jgi:hypothetical protein
VTTTSGASAVTPVEADDVAAAVLTCPSVVDLDGGGPRAVTTLLPGRRVEGVRFTDDAIEVSVVGLLGVPVGVVDAEIRAAVAGLARGRAVHVHIADLRAPDDSTGSPRAGSPAPTA